MSSNGINPVPKTKTYSYGIGESVTQKRLTQDVTNYTRNEVIELLRLIAGTETAQQINFGNPPDIVVSDGTRGKGATEAIKRIEVMFGTRLQASALNVLQAELRKAIGKATQRRTGALANMGNWGWTYIRDGKGQPLPIGSRAGIPLTGNDAIVLRPNRVPHSTVANIRATQGRSKVFAAARAAAGKAPRKTSAGLGFLAQAAHAAGRHPVFAGYKVVVRFTDYTVAGEKWGRGHTGTIMITPNTGRRRGRRR